MTGHPVSTYCTAMVSRHRAVVAVSAVLLLVVAVTAAHAAPLRFLTVPGHSSGDVKAVTEACTQMADALSDRGWTVPRLSVRVADNPFDATAVGTDLSLSASISPADAAFLLAEEVVLRNLSAHIDDTDARMLARLVAAHLSGSDSHRRTVWEQAWQQRLLSGDVATTALVEAVWRQLGDAGVRALAGGVLRDRDSSCVCASNS